MPEDLKLTQIGSSPLPPLFRELNSLSRSRKTLSNYLRLLFPEIVHYDKIQLHHVLGLILRSRRAVDPRTESVQEQAMMVMTTMVMTMMAMMMMTTTLVMMTMMVMTTTTMMMAMMTIVMTTMLTIMMVMMMRAYKGLQTRAIVVFTLTNKRART